MTHNYEGAAGELEPFGIVTVGGIERATRVVARFLADNATPLEYEGGAAGSSTWRETTEEPDGWLIEAVSPRGVWSYWCVVHGGESNDEGAICNPTPALMSDEPCEIVEIVTVGG